MQCCCSTLSPLLFVPGKRTPDKPKLVLSALLRRECLLKSKLVDFYAKEPISDKKKKAVAVLLEVKLSVLGRPHLLSSSKLDHNHVLGLIIL